MQDVVLQVARSPTAATPVMMLSARACIAAALAGLLVASPAAAFEYSAHPPTHAYLLALFTQAGSGTDGITPGSASACHNASP